ncbi:hypothetical protein K469DRAFT_700471 [Zopfia rhizophila CBS 207.26]|uniref:Uncharacterized protein n=1 Tax=Zopfia rhizophila CBS 207.26 TaxID=1314779 RepID=A0A6A6D9B7_9PEZI|nr:hypothetical protein K469DRAFT_700471 [Zopfia rhizophila CBS 207.26]
MADCSSQEIWDICSPHCSCPKPTCAAFTDPGCSGMDQDKCSQQACMCQGAAPGVLECGDFQDCEPEAILAICGQPGRCQCG